MQVVHIGERARAALARSGGIARPLAGFRDAPYLEAGGDVVWIGARLPARHPRAVLTADAPLRGQVLRFAALPAHGWSPWRPELDEEAVARARRSGQVLRTMLAGRKPAFPLDLAAARVDALAAAYRREDPDAVLAASRLLLGVGGGLTPSGDDLAGAALFGRLSVAPRDARWRETAERLSREVAVRSHAVSAALFDDLVRGQSFASLHALVEALAQGDSDSAMSAARTLAAIGHSSGWDMLTGLIIGMGIAPSEAAT